MSDDEEFGMILTSVDHYFELGEMEMDNETLDQYLDGKRSTTSGRVPEKFDHGAPAPIDPATGQHRDYWVLSASERAKGFVRPVRRSYRHLTCGSVTTMGTALAETYARDPKFYGATFCCACGSHLPVGEHGEFVWDDGSNEKVGT
jgi:hypothetical protein